MFPRRRRKKLRRIKDLIRETHMDRVIIGITGATGTIYGVRLMELLRSQSRETGDNEIAVCVDGFAKRRWPLADDEHFVGLVEQAFETPAPFISGPQVDALDSKLVGRKRQYDMQVASQFPGALQAKETALTRLLTRSLITVF